jgi:hypothetical protein
MTTANSSGYKTFQATAVAITEGKRVKVDSNGLISMASGSESSIGVTCQAIAASGYGTVKLWNAPGTFICSAGSNFVVADLVYPTANGNMANSGNTALPLIALEAASAGSLFECAPRELGAV